MLKDFLIKSIFWVLLIMNLMWGVAIAYQKWGGATQSDSSIKSTHEERLAIVDTSLIAANAQQQQLVQDHKCLKMSPLTADQSQLMLTVLESSHAKRFAQDGWIWWIQWGPRDENEARQKLQEYFGKKVDEFKLEKTTAGWLLRAGPFSKEAMALQRLNEMSEKGIKSANVVKEVISNSFEVRFGPWPMKDLQDLAAVAAKSSQAKVVECEGLEKMEWEKAK